MTPLGVGVGFVAGILTTVGLSTVLALLVGRAVRLSEPQPPRALLIRLATHRDDLLEDELHITDEDVDAFWDAEDRKREQS